MDKIKSILGGSNKEENSTYDQDAYSQTASHTGKLTGEGSHLSSATGNPDTISGDPTASTAGPHSSNVMNKADPRVDSNLSQGAATGTDSDFANKAASTAWSSHNQSAPGAFPEEDNSNPYAASSIDPRVDKVPRTQDTSVETEPTASTTGTSLGQTTDASLGQSTDTPPGFSEYGSSGRTGPPSGSKEHSLAGQTPGTSSGFTQGNDNTASQTSVPPTSATSNTTGTTNSQGMMGKALGAIGLGGAAAKADRQTPSTTTGTDAYDTPPQSGELPSHHRKESIPTTAYPSGTLDSPRAMAPPVGAPASGNSTAIADDSGAGDGPGRAAIGQTSTYGSHYLGSGVPTSSIIDPNSSDPNTFRKPETSHLGPDIGLGAGVGAAGAGAASAYDESRDHSGVTSGLQSGAPTSSPGGEHTTFYDAATTGHQHGTTSSGIGSTGTTHGYGATSSGLPGTSTSQEYGTTSSNLPGTSTSQEYGTTSDRHPGRDAAAIGVGASTIGAGAYEYEKHRGPQDTPTGTSTGYGSATGNTTGTAGYQTTPATTGNQTTAQPYDQTGDRHRGGDAATAGAGVGAAAIGAHEYSKHEAKEAETEHKSHDKAVAKEEKKLEKSERQHEKAMEKEEKHREKELAKEERAHEPHSHRKEEAAGAAGAGALGAHEYEEHEKERKPSLLQRILHPRSSKAAGQEETSGLAASDAADSRAFHEHGDTSSGRASNIPPAGYAEPPTKGYASQVTGGTGTTALAQGEGAPSGSHATALGNVFESRDPTVRSGSAANYPLEGGQTTAGTGYAEAPISGYASQVTGGTGTSALATGGAGEPVNQSSTGGGALSEHQHGLQGSGLTRESMTGQPGSGHQFGEVTDHKR